MWFRLDSSRFTPVMLLKTVIQAYPLQGLCRPHGRRKAMINLGSKQGVVLGAAFEALQNRSRSRIKAQTLKSAPKAVAQLKVVQVDPDLCFAEVVSQEAPVRQDDKVREKFESVQ